MLRPGAFALPILLLAASVSLQANPAQGDPRKEKLFAQFIAPCCWRENLLAHHSPKADEMRAEISQWIAEGRTDGEIQQEFIARYSLRILALPQGPRAQWLWWATPVATACGLAALAWFLRRSLQGHPSAAPVAVEGKLPDIPETEWL